MKTLKKKKLWSILMVLIILTLFFVEILNLQGYFITFFNPVVNRVTEVTLLSKVKDFNRIETEHFIIRYDNNDDKMAKITGEIAEKYYKEVSSLFNYDIEDKSNIILYSQGEALLKNTRLKKKTPPLGVYYGGVIHILSPELWIKDDKDLEAVYEKDGPIVHEFTHLIMDKMTHGNYPVWFTEGVALYTEYKVTGFEWGKGLEYNEDITINELSHNFYGINQNLAYRKSFEAIRNISDIWGFDKIVSVMNQLGQGSNFNNSARSVLKISPHDIEFTHIKTHSILIDE